MPRKSTEPIVEDVYTMAAAARLKGVSYHTVSRAVRRGTLPARRLGRMAFIAAGDLRAWRPMIERAPRRYRRRQPDPAAAPALVDLAADERVDLARGLSAILQTAHAAAGAMPAPEFLSLVCERLAAALDVTRVAVWRVDPDGRVAELLAAYDPSDGAPGRLVPPTGWSEVVDRPPTGEDRAGGPSPGLVREIAVPIRFGGRLLGLLRAERGGNPFALTPEQAHLARGLANHAALVMELSRRAAEAEVPAGRDA